MLIPTNSTEMVLRDDSSEGAAALRVHQVISRYSDGAANGSSVLVGFCSDLGVIANSGRPGAKEAPLALRRQLYNFAYYGPRSLFDMGDVVADEDSDLALMQGELSGAVLRILTNGGRPVVIGGGHEVAWGTWGGVRAYLGEDQLRSKRVAVVNLDAHFDIRSTPIPSSGTPFFQIANSLRDEKIAFNYICLGVSEVANTGVLFQRADQWGVEYVLDREMQNYDDSLISEILGRFDLIYLSVDFDVLPPWSMGAVSAPSTMGVPLHVVDGIIETLVASQKVMAIDFAEFNPNFDRESLFARSASRLVMAALR
ncbi:MAG: formimidoylglutamase [Acidimicrobiaceae bacterium]|nr:formimidoylglutamase [Acidimicrobiaceae bacterium]